MGLGNHKNVNRFPRWFPWHKPSYLNRCVTNCVTMSSPKSNNRIYVEASSFRSQLSEFTARFDYESLLSYVKFHLGKCD